MSAALFLPLQLQEGLPYIARTYDTGRNYVRAAVDGALDAAESVMDRVLPPQPSCMNAVAEGQRWPARKRRLTAPASLAHCAGRRGDRLNVRPACSFPTATSDTAPPGTGDTTPRDPGAGVAASTSHGDELSLLAAAAAAARPVPTSKSAAPSEHDMDGHDDDRVFGSGTTTNDDDDDDDDDDDVVDDIDDDTRRDTAAVGIKVNGHAHVHPHANGGGVNGKSHAALHGHSHSHHVHGGSHGHGQANGYSTAPLRHRRTPSAPAPSAPMAELVPHAAARVGGTSADIVPGSLARVDRIRKRFQGRLQRRALSGLHHIYDKTSQGLTVMRETVTLMQVGGGGADAGVALSLWWPRMSDRGLDVSRRTLTHPLQSTHTQTLPRGCGMLGGFPFLGHCLFFFSLSHLSQSVEHHIAQQTTRLVEVVGY